MLGKFALTAAVAALAMGCGAMEKNKQRDGLPADYEARSRGLGYLNDAPHKPGYLDEIPGDYEPDRKRK